MEAVMESPSDLTPSKFVYAEDGTLLLSSSGESPQTIEIKNEHDRTVSPLNNSNELFPEEDKKEVNENNSTNDNVNPEKVTENETSSDAVVESEANIESTENNSESTLQPPAENGFEEHIAKATAAKAEATEAFKNSDLQTARLKYMTVLETLQLVQGTLDNKTKSTLFEQTVTCNNNVALCCIGLEDYPNCVAFAANALVLIRSLERNIPDGQIWKCLQENGITEDQLRKVWKKKALYYMGKAQLKRKNFQEAVENLEDALALIANDEKLVKNANELRGMIADAKTRLNKEKQREKNTWAKAFKKGKVESDTSSAVDSAPSSPVRGAAAGVEDPMNLKFDWSTPVKTAEQKKAKSNNSSTSTAVQKWSPTDIFGQYGFFFALAAAGVAGGAALWFLRYRRK